MYKRQLLLGGGRETKDDVIDPAVGVVLNKKKGDQISVGEPLAFIHANSREKLAEAEIRLKNAFETSKSPVEIPKIIKEVIR